MIFIIKGFWTIVFIKFITFKNSHWIVQHGYGRSFPKLLFGSTTFCLFLSISIFSSSLLVFLLSDFIILFYFILFYFILFYPGLFNVVDFAVLSRLHILVVAAFRTFILPCEWQSQARKRKCPHTGVQLVTVTKTKSDCRYQGRMQQIDLTTVKADTREISAPLHFPHPHQYQ